MNEPNDADAALAALAAEYRTATGCDNDYATQVLALAALGAELDDAGKLPPLVALLALPQTFPPAMVLTALACLTKLAQTPNGRELLFAVGMRIAKESGL